MGENLRIVGFWEKTMERAAGQTCKVSVLSPGSFPGPSMDHEHEDMIHTSAPGLLGGLQNHTMYLLQEREPLPCAGIIRTHPVALQRFSTLESH